MYRVDILIMTPNNSFLLHQYISLDSSINTIFNTTCGRDSYSLWTKRWPKGIWEVTLIDMRQFCCEHHIVCNKLSSVWCPLGNIATNSNYIEYTTNSVDFNRNSKSNNRKQVGQFFTSPNIKSITEFTNKFGYHNKTSLYVYVLAI